MKHIASGVLARAAAAHLGMAQPLAADSKDLSGQQRIGTTAKAVENRLKYVTQRQCQSQQHAALNGFQMINIGSRSMKLAFTYALLALIATAANIGSQDVIIRSYNGAFAVAISVAVGTGVGLAIKYILDKRYIFRFRARNAVHDGQTFVLYTLMGLATTVIFWFFEFGFDHLFGTKEMRYLGGVIGLAIGYLTKYHLDKRYVFGTPGA